MSILKLKPACKDYLWGGEKLHENYHVESDTHPLAEAWMLSCHPDGPSVIGEGPWSGKTLNQYIQWEGRRILGTKSVNFEDFPVLVKFIDAKGDLSIQVHPSDDYALEHEHQYGKTEMWYILDCEPGAYLYYGFQKDISQEEFERRIRENTLTEVLNAVPVQKGDVFFIAAGTLHAICKGIVIAEIQQNSNVTYRVYDYGRVGADGKARALHIPQALAVTDRCPPKENLDFGGHLAKCDYFTVDLHENDFSGEVGMDSFVNLLAVEGEGTVESGSETCSFRKGDSLFLSAGSGPFTVTGKCRMLSTRI